MKRIMSKAEFLKRKRERHETFSEAARELQKELRFTMRKVQNDPSSPENIEKGRRMDVRALEARSLNSKPPHNKSKDSGYPFPTD